MGASIPKNERRVFIGVRIHPSTKKFLEGMRYQNIGRSIDAIVSSHQAYLQSIRNKSGAVPMAPSKLDVKL